MKDNKIKEAFSKIHAPEAVLRQGVFAAIAPLVVAPKVEPVIVTLGLSLAPSETVT